MKLLHVLSAAIALLGGAPVAAQTPTETGQIETAPGVSIYFERHGTGPQFVLIPGRLFMPEFRALAGPGRTLIQYDMRNRGRSGRVEDLSRVTILGDVEDVEALRRYFRAERMALVGFSYLGLMVALYATQHPDRVERLVQIGPAPRRFTTAYPADQRADLSSLDADGRAAGQALETARAATPPLPQAELCRIQARFYSFMLVGNPANHGRVGDNCDLENESPASSERHFGAHFADIQTREFEREPFTALAIPVLTLHGTLDRNAPFGSGLEWATTFRDGRLVTVEGGAHKLWLDDAHVLRDIDGFLAGNWPDRAQRFGRD